MSYSKIFSGDLPELIYEIINYFHNDFSTLHSCILVNRLWCRLAIPLLWEDPFSIPTTKNYNFIEIYLQNLNDDDFKTKLNEYQSNNDLLPSNTLFNYPKFIKYLNTYNVISSIENWISSAVVRTLTTEKKLSRYFILDDGSHSKFNFKKLVNKSLFKIFIENEINLHTLNIEIILYTNDYYNDVLELILQNPNFICNIENLKFYIEDNNLYWTPLSNETHTLTKKYLSQMMNLQKNLK